MLLKKWFISFTQKQGLRIFVAHFFFFSTVVDQAAEFGHFPQKLRLIARVTIAKTKEKSPLWNSYLDIFTGEFRERTSIGKFASEVRVYEMAA